MGPRQSPSLFFVGSFFGFFGRFRAAEKSSRKAVDGKRGGGLYPAPHANGDGRTAGYVCGEQPVERPSVREMFDIVSGRETRAAVLLAGF
jgi:hypothetical protein